MTGTKKSIVDIYFPPGFDEKNPAVTAPQILFITVILVSDRVIGEVTAPEYENRKVE